LSVTITDLLRLPCLREAKVLAGFRGLKKTVASISVLEYTITNELQEDLLNNIEFLGSELVITAFANVKDDVESQCVNIKRLVEIGEVGLILYYVGIVMPKVDKRLIELADALDFPLICMPENRPVRYSEAISEIMEAIFKDRTTDSHFQTEIVERISLLPLYQRSISTAMRMLSDRTRSSLLLTDNYGHLINNANWPHTLKLDAEEFLSRYDGGCLCDLDGQSFIARRVSVNNVSSDTLDLYILKQGEPLTDDDERQIVEVLRLCINLWNRGHGDYVLSELVQAIMRDEPFKMRRIADAFKVDVASIHNMWIITPLNDDNIPLRRRGDARTIMSLLKKELSHICNTIVTDVYEQSIVVFMDDTKESGELLPHALSLAEAIEAENIQATISLYPCLQDTAQVRSAYLNTQEAISTAQYIYPHKKVFIQQEISFAGDCKAILDNGEKAVQAGMEILNRLNSDKQKQKEDLCDTLTVYLLDANSDVDSCARRMFLHRNTIKYRLLRIEEQMLCKVGHMPETIDMYRAVALRRILESNRCRGGIMPPL